MNPLIIALMAQVSAHSTEPLLVTQPQVTQPVCWYQGQEYSEGAVLNLDSRQLICGSKFENEDNGRLIWLVLDEEGQPIRPKRGGSKITIN